jgi:hypothetical protein
LVSRSCATSDPREPSKVCLWRGKYSPIGGLEQAKLMAQNLVDMVQLPVDYELEVLEEGAEPDWFWTVLGGYALYSTGTGDNGQAFNPRLFKCSNKDGYFRVEEISEFCQMDLSDEDVMILDPASNFPSCADNKNTDIPVYLWIGLCATDSEVILSRKAIQVYMDQNSNGQAPRRVEEIVSCEEPMDFKSVFQAWDSRPAQQKKLAEGHEKEKFRKLFNVANAL